MDIKKFFKAFKFLLIFLFLSQSVLAASFRWIGQYDSNWQNPFNWDVPFVPVEGDIAFFSGKPLYQPDNFGTVTIKSLNFNGAKSEFTITNDGQMTFTGNGIDNTGSLSQTLINNKQLNFQGDSMAINVRIVNNGLIDISGLNNIGMTIGSVYGSGDIELGDKILAVGGLNTDDVISGEIRGNGDIGLMKVGTGCLTLAGDNSYRGLTAVAYGLLQVGDGGIRGSLNGDVSLDSSSALVFNRSDTVIFSGQILGNGGVEQKGGGTIIFISDNQYLGLTYIQSGVLQLGEGEGGGFSGDIISDVLIKNGASLVFNRADEVIFGGRISGDGSVVKNGKGTVIFNGYYDYTGGTFVNEGGLLLGGDEADSDAYMKGDVYLAEGATFGGHGTLEGKLINNGVFAPSASIGVTNVTDYEQTAEGTLTVEVDANGRSDLVNATGTASLAGNLVLDTSAGFIPGFEYRFMNADQGITGQFDNVSDSGLLLQNFLTAQVSIDNNTASVVADFNSDAMLAAANTPNRLAVTNFILQGSASPEVQGLVGLAKNNNDFDRLTDQLSASTYANQELQLSQTAKWFDRQLVNRMSDTSGSALWIAPYASTATISGALDTTMGGVAFGSDFDVGENGKWGFAFASTYFSSDASGNETASDDGTLYQFGIYGSSQEAHWLFGAGLEVGITDAINTTRNIGNNTVSSDYHATVFSGQAKASYDIALKDTHVRPFVGLIKQQVSRGSFSESGNTGLASQVNDSDYNSTQSQLGVSAEFPFKSVLLTASAAWQHEFEDTQSDVDFKNGLHIEGVSIGRDSALLQAGVVLLQSDCMTISATYEGVFADSYTENGAKLQVALTIG